MRYEIRPSRYRTEYAPYKNEIRDTITGEQVGEDGGEPEDQTLFRDWAWVAIALNMAYAQGLTDAKGLDNVEPDRPSAVQPTAGDGPASSNT